MKLPDLTQQARPSLQPSLGVARYQTESPSAAAAPGEAMAGLGHQIGQIAQQQIDRADTMRAEDAFNQLRQRQQDLTMGEKGFVHAKGADAVTKPLMQDYSQQFTDVADEISQTLATPRQKELFRQRADMASLQFRDDLLRHVVREGDVYEKQVFDSAAHTEAANVSAHWNEPDSVAISMTRMEALVNQRAKTQGWTPEIKQAVLAEQLGNLHEGVIDQSLANKNYVFAQEWFDKHRDQMDQQTLDKLAPKVEGGVQKQLTNEYTTRFIAASDNYKALSAIEKQVTGDPDLDEERKNVLTLKIQTRMDTLENRARVAEERRMREAEVTYNTLQSLADKGGRIDPEYVDQALNVTRGTPYEKGIQALVKQSKETGGIAQQSLQDQQKLLDQVDALINKNGHSPALDRRRDQIAKVLTASEQAYKNDGIRAALQYGAFDSIAPVDTSTPNALAETIGQRLQQAEIATAKAGKPISPLDALEASNLRDQLNALPPKQKADSIALLSDKMGPKFSIALAQQLDAKDKPLALAFKAGSDRTTEGRYSSELIIEGAQALKDGTAAKDSAKLTGWTSAIANQVSRTSDAEGVFLNQEMENDVKESALYIAAYIAKENGGSSTDIGRAVRLAMGTGQIIERQGRKVPIPAGMKEWEFNQRLESITAKDIGADTVIAGGVAMPADRFVTSLPGQQLAIAGKNRYFVMVGGRPVKKPDGSLVTLRIQ